MITGTLSALQRYKTIHPNLATAIDHVLQLDVASLRTGTYKIQDDDIFYMVNEYSTKPPGECPPERHRKYTDIQVMITGTEKFGYQPFVQQQPSIPFLPDNDVAFYTIPAAGLDYITLDPGKFIIFFTNDIHQPEVMNVQPATVKKLVVKVNCGL